MAKLNLFSIYSHIAGLPEPGISIGNPKPMFEYVLKKPIGPFQVMVCYPNVGASK